ncbi:MAG TPA: hypothetical protein GX520_06080 [Syntrophaceticus sp.]|nr:hypothetical protein [Syntrophaceticus sp.]
MYKKVVPFGDDKVVIADSELGVFQEMKEMAFVPDTMTIIEYIDMLVRSAWKFYKTGIHVWGDTLEEKAKNAYAQFLEKGFLVEISKEQALELFGYTQAEADERNTAGLRSTDE